MADKQEKTWLGFPEPQDTDSIARISSHEVADILRGSDSETRDSFKLIDVRRGDLTDAIIRTSINLPAHTFYPTRADIAALLSRYDRVALFCGSSQGRGPRCAGWLRDALQAQSNTNTKVLIMEGGIKGFLRELGNDSGLVHQLPAELKDS